MFIAFYIFIAVAAVAVFVVATGGRRRSLPGESRAGKQLIAFVVLVAFAFGLVVPVIVLRKNGEGQAATAAGVHLTASEVKGRELFSTKCAVCHTLGAAAAVGRVGPKLEVRVAEEPTFKAREELVYNAIREGRSRGLGNMPSKLFEGAEARQVAEFVAAVAGRK